jgi:hypothetical protein
MNNHTTNPSDGVITETSVNETNKFDPIKEQTTMVLEMVREHFEWEITKKKDYIKFLKEEEEKDLKEDKDVKDLLLDEETDLNELRFLCGFVINLQKYREVV